MLEPETTWRYNATIDVASWRQTYGWNHYSVAWSFKTPTLSVVHNTHGTGIPQLPTNWMFL